MTEKLKNIVTVALLGALLLTLSAWAVVKPADALSESERRPLAQLPALSGQSLLSGRFMEQFESYAPDQFPLREQFRSLKAFAVLDLFREKDNNGIYLSGGSAVKLEYPLRENSIAHAAERFGYIYDRYLAPAGSRVFLSVVPDKNCYLAADGGYPSLDYQKLTEQLRSALPAFSYIDLFPLLDGDSYYRTDIHWRQEKLPGVAAHIAAAMGAALTGGYTEKTLGRPFYGVYYGQAALPLAPDELRYLTSPALDGCTVYNHETQKTTGLYDMDKAAGNDPYALFLSGSVSLLTIENPHAADRELIVFRDSFGSSLVPLLAEGYRRITLVDIRYLASARLADFIEFNGQDVLFLYSVPVLNNSETLK